jgi:hypothetical protein
MAGAFLLISPALRNDVATGYTRAGTALEQNSPYSYVVLGIVGIGLVMNLITRSAQPR